MRSEPQIRLPSDRGPEIVVERDPGLRGFGDQHFRGARRGIDREQVERLLVAALALDVERAAVLRPVDACDIDVGIGAEIDLGAVRAVGGHHRQRDRDIGGARGGVALVERLGAIGTDRGARHRLDVGFIEAFDRDMAVARCPPRAGGAFHLFLRDEFGGAAGDGAPALPGERLLLGRRQIERDQILVADEADIAASLGDVRVDLGLRRVGQPADLAVERGEIEIAVDRDEDALAVGRPVVVDDPFGAADARALATHLLPPRKFRRPIRPCGCRPACAVRRSSCRRPTDRSARARRRAA